MPEKIRELNPLIQAAITSLVNMSSDASKLEYYDNDQASRRLKQAVVDFRHDELGNLEKAIKEIRSTINNKSNLKKQKT